MNKKEKREYKENVRREIAKQYADRYERDVEEVRKHNVKLMHLNHTLNKEITQTKCENEELKEKVNEYEGVITKLTELLNLPEDEREKAVEKYRTEKKLTEYNNYLMSRFGKCLTLFG